MNRVRSLLAFAQAKSEAAKNTRPMRTWARFTAARGPILAAGISFIALFSLTAALTVGWSLFSSVMKDPVVSQSVTDALNTMFPGLIKTDAVPDGLVHPSSLESTPGTSIAGIVALLAGMLSASSVVAHLAKSIRSMFGLGQIRVPWYLTYATRFLGLAALFVSLASMAALMALNTFLRNVVDQEFGWANEGWTSHLFSFGSILVPLIIDFGVFIIMVRWVALVRPLRRDLLQGAAIAAVGSLGLRLASTWVVGQVSGPILTAATTLITMAAWVNLLATVYLAASAWTANPPKIDQQTISEYHWSDRVPNFVTLSDPSTLEWENPGADLSADSEL